MIAPLVTRVEAPSQEPSTLDQPSTGGSIVSPVSEYGIVLHQLQLITDMMEAQGRQIVALESTGLHPTRQQLPSPHTRLISHRRQTRSG
ncbi:hypothetical protein CCR75_008695 [Bremia lactucae]|uniref:Uncharacterized protein n=1 Tax=Bremia lactucae TaxID=4779 RepID=A0A976NZ74_BRELC|nr:hypothetical protein CCR75_008695 [Bremia lactucae]